MMEMKYLLLLAAVVSVQAAIPQLAASEVHIPPLLLLYTYQPSSCTNCHEYTSQFELLQQLPNAKEYQLGQLNCLIWAKYCFTLPKKAPAIFLFAGGEPLVYEGEVEAQLIDAWVNGVIESGIAKLSKAEVEKKKGKENFVLVGGLDINEKVKLATIRSTRYLNLPFYQIETDKPVFKLYLSSRGQDEINYKVPLDAFLVGFQIFHRTRPYLIPLNVPQYLSYFHNQVDSEQIMIFVDHKDTFSTTALSYLKSYCYKQLATVICFTIQKDSPILGELPGKELLSEINSSLLFLKQKKQIGYLYPSKVLNYDKLTQFIEQAKNNSIKANFDNTPDKVVPFKYDHAIKLTSRNYKSTINTNPIVIVKFYAPGCGYCKKLAPGYDEAAKYFKQQGSEVVVATVDADQEVAIADQQKIEKYPTLKVFINRQAIEYTGKYSGQGIIEYLSAIETAKLAIIQSLDQITRPGLVISGIDENSNLHRLPGLFTSLPIYWLKNEQALRVNIYNKDDSVKKFTGKVKLAAVLNWLSEETEPVLVNLGNSEMSRKLTKAISQKKPILGLINKGVHSIEAVSQFLSGYCEKKKDFICGVATKGEDDYQHLAQWLNVPATEDNYLFWIDLYKTKSYLFSQKLEALNTDSLDAFVKGIKKGSVKENVRGNQIQEEKNGQTQLESKQSEKVQVQSVQSKQGTETQGEEL